MIRDHKSTPQPGGPGGPGDPLDFDDPQGVLSFEGLFTFGDRVDAARLRLSARLPGGVEGGKRFEPDTSTIARGSRRRPGAPMATRSRRWRNHYATTYSARVHVDR